MENTSLIALSLQSAIRRQMSVIANNIANMNTTGFKGEKMMFVQHLVRSEGGERLWGERIAFVRDIATMRDTSEGPLEKTGNPLDIAVSGNGYFVIGTDVGERYTRNGNFQLDNEGQIVNQHGDPLLSDSGQPFFLSPEDIDITVARDGTISTENGELGRIRVVSFENRQELRNAGEGMLATDKEPQDVDNPDLVQFMLEGSNVQPIIEMTRMIETQRAYGNVKLLIDKEDERQKKMIQEYGKVAA